MVMGCEGHVAAREALPNAAVIATTADACCNNRRRVGRFTSVVANAGMAASPDLAVSQRSELGQR